MAQQEFTDAIALLKADHREVEELFAKFEGATGDGKKQQIAEKICTELKIHTTIEEEIFYPALRGKIEDDLLDEGYVEHDGAKVLINDIMAGGPGDEFYDAKVKVLSEEIEHHVKEEEEELFPKVEKAFEADRLTELGKRMKERFDTVQSQGFAAAVPKGPSKTSSDAEKPKAMGSAARH